MEPGETPSEAFARVMTAAGWEVIHHHGANFWHGPAVVVEDVANQPEVERLAPVPIQSDNYGYRWVFYPVDGEPDAWSHWLELNPHLSTEPDRP